MLLHFDLVGFGSFCNGACFCLFQLKEKRKVLKMCGCGKGQDYFGEGFKGWWVRGRRKAHSFIYSSLQES
jgi:hypothetical protein